MNKKGKVYKSLWISYVLLMCIPVIIGIALYSYTYKSVKKQNVLYNKNLMKTIASTCDKELDYYKQVLKEISTREYVRSLVSIKEYDEQRDAWNVYQVAEEVKSRYNLLREHANECADFFVYLKKDNKFIGTSGATSFQVYSELYYDDAEALYDFLQRAESDDMLVYNKNETTTYILLVKKLTTQNGRTADALAGVWIDVSVLEEKIASDEWNANLDWTMVTKDGQQLRAMDDIMIEDKAYISSVLTSEVLDLDYYLFSPMSVVEETAKQIRNVHILSLALVMLIGMVITHIFLQKHYDPLEKIAAMLKRDGEEGSVKDEYQYLTESISKMLHETHTLSRDVRKKENILYTQRIENLLLGTVPKEDTSICEKFATGKNLVLVCEYLAEGAEEGEETKLKQFIIQNIFSEKLDSCYVHEAVEQDKKEVFIVNIPAEDDMYSLKLQETLEDACQVIEEKFLFQVFVYEGGVYEGVDKICKSYIEACDTTKFKESVNDVYIRYEDIKDLTIHKYEYTFEMEARLVGMVRDNNVKAAQLYINNILDNNWNRKDASPEMLNCLLYDIFNTLLKVSEEQGINNTQLMTMKHIDVKIPLDRIKDFYWKILEKMCREQERVQDKNQTMCTQVLAYIKKHFDDPDLNLSQTAQKFGMTPSYLSSIFKAQTGKSIVDVIRAERIAKAQQLLEQGISVSDVAQQVGFRDRTSFIRTFKKCTGLTPGSVKK